jgi:hypothetical protein
MINAASGAAFVQQATHIDSYTTVAQHYRPDDQVNSQLPSLASGDVQRANMLSTDGNTVKSIVLPLTEYDTGALYDITPNPSIPMGSNPLPIALVLSANAIAAPYFVESGVNGETDIVLSFPMRKHGIFNGGTLTNDLDGSGTQVSCVGTLNDGIDDGDTVTLDSLSVQVNDYPHDGSGSYCTNAGYTANSLPDVEVSGLHYYDYAESAVVFESETWILAPPPTIITLDRAVNIFSTSRASGGNQSVLGTPAENVIDWELESGFEAGWLSIAFENWYDYEVTTSIIALTESISGVDSESGVWTGVPVIGFSAMAVDLGPSQLGEVVELYRSVNRN